jgi:hypothetical protein
VTTGWFDDPYGRHEARWMSDGWPTSLVRDGTVEKTDPLPDQLSGVPLVQAQSPRSAPTPGSDPVQRGGQSATIRSRRRLLGVLIFVVGLAGVLGGLYLIQAPLPLPTHRFTPSAAELAVPRAGGTALPPRCSSTATNPPSNNLLGFTINPGDADTQFTVYPHSEMVLPAAPDYEAKFSANAPICQLGRGEYYVERPGKITVYFISTTAEVSVVRIVVTASSPPATPAAGWVLLALGALACFVGFVLAYRRHDDRQLGDRLRRADDAERNGSFDRQRAQRRAWDIVIDQQSGQF